MPHLDDTFLIPPPLYVGNVLLTLNFESDPFLYPFPQPALLISSVSFLGLSEIIASGLWDKNRWGEFGFL